MQRQKVDRTVVQGLVYVVVKTSSETFPAGSWVGSTSAFEDQRERRLIACPVCGDSDVAKAVMAPNVAAKGNARPPALPAEAKAALAKLAAMQAKVLEGSEWVGPRFSERARAMHAGEAPTAPIHGQATLAEAKALADDGVAVAPLPLPVVPPQARN